MEILQTVFDWTWSHSPFFAALFCGMLFGQVAKTTVFTEVKAKTPSPWQGLWWWGWKSLPLHPVLAGWLLGYVVTEPEAGIVGPNANLYFAHAGVHSVWVYQVAKGFAKKRGIELTLPGESARPKRR